MTHVDLMEKLSQFGINSKDEFIERAYSRNIGILSKEEMEILSKSRVAIPGMGGVGGLHLITLTRLGIGCFNIADFDKFDVVNTNRQYGAKISNYGRAKVACMAQEARDVNPYLDLNIFEEGILDENLDEFLTGVDIVIDGLDFFEFDMRRKLFNRAREKGIHVITAGPLGFGSAVLVFSPHKGMSFDEYFDVYKGMPEMEKYINFALGLAPKGLHIKYIDKKSVDLKSKRGPSSIIACNICAALAGMEAVKILLKKGKVKPVPHYVQFDPFRGKLVKGYLFRGNRNLLQQVKKHIVINYMLKLDVSEEVRPPRIPKVEGDFSLTKDITHFLLSAGIFAPSGDNAQPWKFSVEENKISVFLDAEKDTSFFNIDQIASIISCGAVIENIKIASTVFSIVPKVEILPKSNDKDLMGVLDFGKIHKSEKDPLYDYLWTRHTNRKFYHSKKIEYSILRDIKAEGERFSGVKVKLITDRTKIKEIGKLIYNVDKIRVEFRPLHEYLMKMIRFNHKEVYSTRNGLPLKNLEAGIQGEIFLRLTKPWPVMNVFNKLQIGNLVAFHSYRCIKTASGIGLITVSGSDRAAFLKGGRAMQRVWLDITRKGLHFQPMTAITLFWERWKRNKDTFLLKHIEMLKDIWPKYAELFDLDLDKDETHIMLFRFGTADSDIKVRTLRQDVEDFIVHLN